MEQPDHPAGIIALAEHLLRVVEPEEKVVAALALALAAGRASAAAGVELEDALEATRLSHAAALGKEDADGSKEPSQG